MKFLSTKQPCPVCNVMVSETEIMQGLRKLECPHCHCKLQYTKSPAILYLALLLLAFFEMLAIVVFLPPPEEKIHRIIVAMGLLTLIALPPQMLLAWLIPRRYKLESHGT